MIIYEGPSQIDNSPIVMIALPDSTNRKTGNIVQTYIMRSDIHPMDAINSGADESICGGCVHRKAVGSNGRTCYVFPPSFAGIWKKYKAGGYDRLNGRNINKFRNRVIRFGAYGDPMAVPPHVWERITKHASNHTSYTHQWERLQFHMVEIAEMHAVNSKAYWTKKTMASVESLDEKKRANSMGYKTYRVGLKGERPQRDEMLCPASDEAGKALTCDQCLRCNGTSKNIFIPVHGTKGTVNKFQNANQ